MLAGGRVARLARGMEGAAGSRIGVSRCLLTLSLITAALACALALPIGAFASLPDNRIYEQVSPANKDGNVLSPSPPFPVEFGIFLASGSGNAVAYQSSGAIGSVSNQGGIQEDISRHVAGLGWTSEPADSRQLGQLGLVASAETPGFYPSSADFNHVYFDPTGCCTETRAAYSPEEPGTGLDLKLYLNENPLGPPVWVGKPMIENPFPAPGATLPNWSVAGVSPEGTMYFSYSGTLLPDDSSRAPHVGNGIGGNENGEGTNTDAWGFYEYDSGGLTEAGVRPDGTLSPWGSVSAAIAPTYRGRTAKNGEQGPTNEEQSGQVSEDGKRAFFVSPDPLVEQVEGTPPNTKPVAKPEPPELYMRETLAGGEHRSVLISRSEIASEEKQPTANAGEEPAPGGVNELGDASPQEYNGGASDVYASPDGSHIIFASNAALTSAVTSHSEFFLYMGEYTGGHFKLEVTTGSGTQTTAPIPWEATPAEVQSALEALSNIGAGQVIVQGNPPHEYNIRFTHALVSKLEINESETVGGAYKYVSNVTSPNVYEFDLASETLSFLPELAGARFAASSTDGSRMIFVTPAGDLDLFTNGSEGPKVETIVSKVGGSVTPARAAADGSAFMFYAGSGAGGPLSQFNNGGFSQFYHYDVASKELACVSCPPPGVTPTASAETNRDSRPRTLQPVRMMSEDGTRVFFQSPDPLVGADVNGKPDVYEWENGSLYLISAGNSTVNSYYVDNSASGGDVFFATEQGLTPSDEDEQMDLYDARIPRPGDNPPPEQTPCSGEVCQGPPSVPQLLTAASSATFEGLGNIPPEAAPKTEEAVKKAALKCKRGFVKKNGKCVKKKAKKKANKAKRSATTKRGGK